MGINTSRVEQIIYSYDPNHDAGRILWTDVALADLCIVLARRLEEAERKIDELTIALNNVPDNPVISIVPLEFKSWYR